MNPALRQDLQLYDGPLDKTGAPTWSLLDPIRNLYFHLDWKAFEILSRWHLADSEHIIEELNSSSPLQVQEDDIKEIQEFIQFNELSQRADPESCAQLLALEKQRRQRALVWLFHHYLFFRVPLWRPDRWLEKHVDSIAPLLTRGFLWLTLFVWLFGLVEVSRQWDVFSQTIVNTFSWRGFVGFALTLVLVKFFHELGHGFVAKYYGCRVPRMGVAFLVLLPMAYTDVNDAWKLKDKRQRLAIGSAGMGVEFTIAIWSTALWCLLPDGTLRSQLFLLSTTTWVSSLLINLSPFMRFDGYFLLMDWLEFPNLHQRSFALGTWKLRQWLFQLDTEPPEAFAPHQRRALIVFAVAVWLYRLMLFLGIAVLVYYAVPKPVGPLLAVLELHFFIVRPIYREIKHWPSLMTESMANRKLSRTALATLLVLLIMIAPWDPRISVEAVIKPARSQEVIFSYPGQIDRLLSEDIQRVKEGDIMASLTSDSLDAELGQLTIQRDFLDTQLAMADTSPTLRQEKPVLGAAKVQIETEMEGLANLQGQYHPEASFSGQLLTSNPDLAQGNWVSTGEPLGTLVDASQWELTAYVAEAQLRRVDVGMAATFFFDNPEFGSLKAVVTQVNQDASRSIGEPLLTQLAGGSLLVKAVKQELQPESALYRIQLRVEDEWQPNRVHKLKGTVVLYAKAQAYIADMSREALSVVYRELGF